MASPRCVLVVEKGKGATGEFPPVRALKRVDFPAFGNPTIPRCCNVLSLLSSYQPSCRPADLPTYWPSCHPDGRPIVLMALPSCRPIVLSGVLSSYRASYVLSAVLSSCRPFSRPVGLSTAYPPPHPPARRRPIPWLIPRLTEVSDDSPAPEQPRIMPRKQRRSQCPSVDSANEPTHAARRPTTAESRTWEGIPDLGDAIWLRQQPAHLGLPAHLGQRLQPAHRRQQPAHLKQQPTHLGLPPPSHPSRPQRPPSYTTETASSAAAAPRLPADG